MECYLYSNKLYFWLSLCCVCWILATVSAEGPSSSLGARLGLPTSATLGNVSVSRQFKMMWLRYISQGNPNVISGIQRNIGRGTLETEPRGAARHGFGQSTSLKLQERGLARRKEEDSLHQLEKQGGRFSFGGPGSSSMRSVSQCRAAELWDWKCVFF